MKWIAPIAALLTGLIFWIWSETVAVRLTTISLDDVAPSVAAALGDTRVAFLADFHTGQTSIRERRALKMLENLDPDLVLLGGDYIDDQPDTAGCREFLTDLARIAPTIGIFGNNDHADTTGIRLVEYWSATGIHFLQNEATIVVLGEAGQDSIAIIGVDDNYSWFDDPIGASRGVPTHLPRILMAHAPGIATKIDPAGIDLILSGHTHAGQIRIPGLGAFFNQPVCNARRDLNTGVYNATPDFDHSPLIVTSGVGTSMFPFRLFSPPEIILFE